MLFGDIVKAAFKGNPRNSTAVALPDTWAASIHGVTDHKFYLPPPAQSREQADAFNVSPRVRSIVSKIAKGVAKQPWYLEDKAGERVDEHEALAFWNSGNPKLPGSLAREVAQSFMDLNGEVFIVVGREGLNPDGSQYGKPRFWAPIPPYWVFDVPDDLVNGQFKINPINQAPLLIDAKDVIYLREIDPTRPYGRGSSFAGAANLEIATDKAAAEYLRYFFKNNARPDLIVHGQVNAAGRNLLSEMDRTRLEAYWLERHRGTQAAGRPFFSTGPLEVKELGSALRDNEMSKMRDQLGAALLEHWGIPPEIMGRLESSNRATIDSADFLFARHVLEPRLDALCAWLTPFIDLEFGLSARGLKLRYETPVIEDKEFKLKVMTAAPAAFTDNERRTLAGYKPLDGLDELPEPVEPDGDEPPKPGGNKNDKKAVDSASDDTLSPSPMKIDTEIKADAAHIWRSISPADLISVSAAHEDPQVRMEATAIFRRVFEDLLLDYGAELLGELESEATFHIHAAAADWLDKRSSWLIGTLDETTRTALQASLLAGVAENETVETLARRIEAVFEAAADTRSALIGQTEATALTGYGSQAAAEQGGFRFKEWLSTRDQAVRDTHKALDGQRVPTTSDFVSPSGAHGAHPGDMSERKENINCRCAMRPVLDGEKAMSAEAFVTFHGHQMDSASTTVQLTAKKIFRAQRELVLEQLKRVAGKV